MSNSAYHVVPGFSLIRGLRSDLTLRSNWKYFCGTPAALSSLLQDSEAATDFVDGLYTMAGNGSAEAQHGVGIHLYAANRSMQGRFFYDADGAGGADAILFATVATNAPVTNLDFVGV